MCAICKFQLHYDIQSIAVKKKTQGRYATCAVACISTHDQVEDFNPWSLVVQSPCLHQWLPSPCSINLAHWMPGETLIVSISYIHFSAWPFAQPATTFHLNCFTSLWPPIACRWEYSVQCDLYCPPCSWWPTYYVIGNLYRTKLIIAAVHILPDHNYHAVCM